MPYSVKIKPNLPKDRDGKPRISTDSRVTFARGNPAIFFQRKKVVTKAISYKPEKEIKT